MGATYLESLQKKIQRGGEAGGGVGIYPFSNRDCDIKHIVASLVIRPLISGFVLSLNIDIVVISGRLALIHLHVDKLLGQGFLDISCIQILSYSYLCTKQLKICAPFGSLYSPDIPDVRFTNVNGIEAKINY